MQARKAGHLEEDGADKQDLHKFADRVHTVLKNPIDTSLLGKVTIPPIPCLLIVSSPIHIVLAEVRSSVDHFFGPRFVRCGKLRHFQCNGQCPLCCVIVRPCLCTRCKLCCQGSMQKCKPPTRAAMTSRQSYKAQI